MRAAVMRGAQLVVDDIPDPVPGPGEVLVQVLACGICGSDLHALRHAAGLVESSRQAGGSLHFDTGSDVVMGHEFSARVLEAGPGASGVEPGDVVVCMPVIPTSGGMASIGYSNRYPGGYAERMVLSSALSIKVPDGLDPRRAALTEPMAVGEHAVNRSGITSGEAALVIGCGPIGLACIASLSRRGIEPVVAADLSPKRRDVAGHMGAHVVVDPAVETAIAAWRRVDGSRKLHLFEAVGIPGMIAQAMRDAPRSSRITVVGVCMEQDTIAPMVGINKELSIQFCLAYDRREFAGTLEAIASGEIDVAPLITGSVGIDGVPAAFETLSRPTEHVKILVEP